MKIEILSPVFSKLVTGKVKDLHPCLSYESVYYTQGFKGKERKTYRKTVIDNKGIFPTGLIPRVKFFCKKQKIELEIVDLQPKVESVEYQDFPNLSLRGYQEEAVRRALMFKRGIIHVPTGGGKTRIAMGIASHFLANGQGVLFIVHKKDLITQTIKAAKLIVSENKIGIVGDGETRPNLFTVGMVQTLHRLDLQDYGKKVSLVVVDETHHVSKADGTYVKVLEQIECPYRIGLTATLPYKEEAKVVCEGYIGNVISEVEIEELTGDGILATPKIKIVQIPTSYDIMKIRNYQEAYRAGVVERYKRNEIIAKSTIDLLKDCKTALVLVNLVEHGHNLLEIFQEIAPKVKSEYVHGATESSDRETIKDLLNQQKVQVVIATAVFKEGTDIPSLGAVVNAGGGKSEIVTLQAIGRGLRTTPDKKDVILLDFFDGSSRFLISHFGERISLYCTMGWL